MRALTDAHLIFGYTKTNIPVDLRWEKAASLLAYFRHFFLSLATRAVQCRRFSISALNCVRTDVQEVIISILYSMFLSIRHDILARLQRSLASLLSYAAGISQQWPRKPSASFFGVDMSKFSSILESTTT